MGSYTAALLALLPCLAMAGQIPDYSSQGLKLYWGDAFGDGPGQFPNSTLWNVAEMGPGQVPNGEQESYVKNTNVIAITSGQTLQITPQKDGTTGQWTSGRIGSVVTFTPIAGQVMRVESQIRLGPSLVDNLQGIWPAFWMLGASYSTPGVGWPACGELDIMERKNGALTNYGSAHCGVVDGGPCNQPTGLSGSVALPDNTNYHTFTVTVDRKAAPETITWSVDGNNYYQLVQSAVNNDAIWASIAQNPMNIIINVAVGGGFPGNTNDQTQGGPGAVMEINYVAVYATA
ncbi:glycoside hydrolase family 16 protein [Mariannaea sp. PMI_226]|nr:glycoside hydrolase family 16 protein [Mariannaea sp. PMI_226]